MADAAQNVRTQAIQIPRSGQNAPSMAGYLAAPPGPGPFPGVVVIHEIFGLNDNIRDIARRFAREGYAALAMDLCSHRSRVACMMSIVYGMMIHPIENGTVGDLRQSLAYLRQEAEVDPRHIGVVGFCMGGTFALQLAIADQNLQGASVFYGQNPRPLEAVARACPIVGSYPENDFTAQQARALEPVLERYEIPHDLKIYPNARHSFFNDQGQSFNPDAAADAWKRMLAFFELHLKGNPTVE